MVKNLVLSGAGFKCWAYIGTLRALNEYQLKDIEHVVGVSAGGIFGLMYILGAKPEFLLKFFIDNNVHESHDVDIDNILIQNSLFAGIKFFETVKTLISHYVDPDITFKGLYRYSKIKFTVNALNITDSKLEYFNYLLTPEIKVIDALIASASLPIILPAHTINGKNYYDGGLCNNCPVDIVEEVDTISFKCTGPMDKSTGINLLDLLNTLIKLIHKNVDTQNAYNVLDSSFIEEMFNLNQTRDDIFNIYMHGYINSKNIIFDNYIALQNTTETN